MPLDELAGAGNKLDKAELAWSAMPSGTSLTAVLT